MSSRSPWRVLYVIAYNEDHSALITASIDEARDRKLDVIDNTFQSGPDVGYAPGAVVC